MSPTKSNGPIQSLLEAERRLHELAPIKDIYSKLFLRTIAWFLFFWLLYVGFTAVV
ncbi:hypothetical protein [Salinadaptatus halalkaliphilus]|uniref:hypothetical protein n=1 Tax=Salinadaptatus halalkaliphilus TaxID=2419781 RepID=UPI001580E524|nr:hypothetical protein [Salinadaptatus halalkaliphilus]